jgi:hypothetical protein
MDDVDSGGLTKEIREISIASRPPIGKSEMVSLIVVQLA